MKRHRPSKKSLDPAEAKKEVEEVFSTYRSSLASARDNEATTRITLVDRILAAVGWQPEEIDREVPSGVGTFLDYELWDNERPWMLIESKRAGDPFKLESSARSSTTTEFHDIGRLLRSGGRDLKEAFTQAAEYCNNCGIPLACITNGVQWLFFRGLSSPDRPWHHGVALTFATMDEVINRFDTFFMSIGRTSAGTQHLLQHLDRPSPAAPPTAFVPNEYLKTRKPDPNSQTTPHLRAVCDFLLGEIHGANRQEMMRHCYIEPGVEAEFEKSVQRLLRDTAQTLESTHDTIAHVDSRRFVEEVSIQESLAKAQDPIVVVGHVGAGKTTFLHKSIARFREDHSAFCSIINLEGHGHGGNLNAAEEEKRVAAQILKELPTAARAVLAQREDVSSAEREQADPFHGETLKNLFQEELAIERRLGAKVWASNPAAWDQKEYEILAASRQNVGELLFRFLRYLQERFQDAAQRKYPILVMLDNLDQATDEYQRCIYGFAQRLSRDTPAVIVICLREDTYARGKEPGGFLTSSSLPFVFHVPAPPLDKMLRQRVEFGEYALRQRLLPMPWMYQPPGVQEVCRLLRTVFLSSGSEALELLACLCGNSIRQGLSLVRSVVHGSTATREQPHSGAAYALECLLSSLGQEELKPLLFNCFDADPATPPYHALRVRILGYCSWASASVNERPLLEATDQIQGRFAEWGYPVAMVYSAIDALLTGGMLKPFAESERGKFRKGDRLPRRITLTAAGHAHISRLLSLPAYRAAMACITRWYDEDMGKHFVKRSQRGVSSEGEPTVGDIVASGALEIFDAYLNQFVAREDHQLAAPIKTHTWAIETLSRAARVVANPIHDVSPGHVEVTVEQSGTTRADARQMNLALNLDEPSERSALPRLGAGIDYKGSQYIPRILWALEWAHLHKAGRLSAVGIAKVLKTHCDLDETPSGVSKALSLLKGDSRAVDFWAMLGRSYEITAAGRKVLHGILAAHSRSSRPRT
ncbi:ATP-binding protein [Hyalangium gracile]|uniref:ATP-binding protein n=1 Tax=Hyalangium gracile TaxID=394092 RepID=UPI001CCF6D4F|nr:ATP-binding protein [Hyalangium gracile]